MGGTGEDLRGKDAILSNSLLLLKAFSGLKFTEVLSATNEETGVGFVLYNVVGTQTGSLMGIIPATGKTLNVPLFETARVDAEGRFVELFTSIDKFLILGQIGVFQFLKTMFPAFSFPGLDAGGGAASGGAASGGAGGAAAMPAMPAIPPALAAMMAAAAASSAKPAAPAPMDPALAAAMAAGAKAAAAGRAAAAAAAAGSGGGAPAPAPVSDGSDWLTKE
jgi:hypothetical protein